LQRTADAELTSSAHSGSKIIEVVRIRAVDHMSQASRVGEFSEPGVKFGLAEEAALVRIVSVPRVCKLRRIDKYVLGANLVGDDSGLVHFLGSVGLRQTGRCHSERSERPMRDREEIAAIDSARE